MVKAATPNGKGLVVRIVDTVRWERLAEAA
jgi:hypothetical protein